MTVISASRQATEHSMTTWDGSELFYRVWQGGDCVEKNSAQILKSPSRFRLAHRLYPRQGSVVHSQAYP
jgi:hypothetical protein